MGRYEEASKNIYNMVRDAVNKHFPDLADARFFIWMDSQKRTSSGKTVPGSILKANSVVNFLAHDDYDYVIKLDRALFENISDADQLGLLLHLLCHTKVVTKAEEEKYSLVAPDYPLFEQELELIPYWREFFQRLQTTAAEVHEKTPAVPANSPDAPNMFPVEDVANEEEQEAA